MNVLIPKDSHDKSTRDARCLVCCSRADLDQMRYNVLQNLEAIDRSLRSLRDQFLPYLNGGTRTAAQLGRLILSHLINDMEHHMELKQVQVERQQQAVQDAKQELEWMKSDSAQRAYLAEHSAEVKEMSDSARERFIAEALQKQHDIVQKVIEARNKAWAQAMNMMELKKIIQTAITHSDDSINVPKQYELLKIQNQYIEIFYQREELYCLLRMLDVRLRYHNVDTKYILPWACGKRTTGSCSSQPPLTRESVHSPQDRRHAESRTSDNILHVMKGHYEYTPSMRTDKYQFSDLIRPGSLSETSSINSDQSESIADTGAEGKRLSNAHQISSCSARNKTRLVPLLAAYTEYINEIKSLVALKSIGPEQQTYNFGKARSRMGRVTVQVMDIPSCEDTMNQCEALLENAEYQHTNSELSGFTAAHATLQTAHLKTQVDEITTTLSEIASKFKVDYQSDDKEWIDARIRLCVGGEHWAPPGL